MKIVDLPKADEQTKESLLKCVDAFREKIVAGELEGCLLIGLTKEQEPMMQYTGLSQVELCGMEKFLGSWNTNYFLSTIGESDG